MIIQTGANPLLPTSAESHARIEIETAVELVSFRGASYRRPSFTIPRLTQRLLLFDILELDRLVPDKDTLKQEKTTEGKSQFCVHGIEKQYERERGRDGSPTFPRYGSGFLHRLILAANNPNFCLSVPWSTILVG